MKKIPVLPDKYKKIIAEFSRIFLGCLFIFSGFVKAIDPLGGTYKNIDYFEAFGLGFFNFSALPFAIFLSALEFSLGIGLIMGVYRRFHSILVLLFMLFMTPLTLYLAIANPVSDCGCFGEALVISNWQTFIKNLFLLAAAIVLYYWYKRITPLFSRKSRSLVVLWCWIFILGLSLYCYTYLPILDFRPYKVGADIPELMKIPDDAEHDLYESVLIYSKDGKTEEFTLENYPRDDDSWVFVDSRSKLVKKGYEAPIHDFAAVDEEGVDITERILSNPSYTFLLVGHKLEKAKESNVDRINGIYDYARSYGYDFYALTSSLPEGIREWVENTGAEYPFCTMDDITLKTIVRSNPGLLLIHEGVIINKWPHRTLPEESLLNQPLEVSPLGEIPPRHEVRSLFALTLLFLTPLIALWSFDFFRYRRKEMRKRGENLK